ncbi:MAG: RNA-directed DNA polymerase [Rhodobacteraceae bacterium]|nr:RNA-directed DNA polymerase [Paracoccaceae bacterium]
MAASLSATQWQAHALERVFRSRLPTPLAQYAAEFSAGLIAALPSAYAPEPAAVAAVLVHLTSFEQVTAWAVKNGHWPVPDLRETQFLPIAAFADLSVPKLATMAQLGDWLGLSQERLAYLADTQARHEEHGETAINHYHYVLQRKKGPGLRLIEAPKQRLKAAQHQILRQMLDPLPVHDDAYGFVRGRSCQAHAARHAGTQMVVSFDMRQFFPSISAGRVFGLFRCLGYPSAVAHHLTGLCTSATPPRILQRLPYADRVVYRAAHLPQGAPSSPALAYHVAFRLDRRLSALADSLDATYGRYADDLSFSGDRRITEPLMRLVPQILREEGFCLNPSKTRAMPQTARQSVTGIVVNQHLNIARGQYDRLKAVVHACGKPDDSRLADPVFRGRLEGQIGWVASLNRARGAKLQALFNTALDGALGG